jgi:hypothetical protein
MCYRLRSMHPCAQVEACLKFRQAEEFERLLCGGGEPMDLPEVDDGELDPVEQGRAAT